MDYKDQLKHPKWQKKRLEILNRDEFTCQLCKSTEKTLHVHHLYYDYKKRLWEYKNETMVTLCEECHSFIHSKMPKFTKYLEWEHLYPTAWGLHVSFIRNFRKTEEDVNESFEELKRAFKEADLSFELLGTMLRSLDLTSLSEKVIDNPTYIDEIEFIKQFFVNQVCGTQLLTDMLALKKLGFNISEINNKVFGLPL